MNDTEDEYAEMARADPLVMWIEKGNHSFVRRLYRLLLNRHYIDTFYYKVASAFVKFSKLLEKHVEDNVDLAHRHIGKHTHNFAEKVRKLQTGVLSWNMVLVLVGAVLVVLPLVLEGILK
jgi:NADH:ubiquinone oxidoreductase subunit 5 (subunit L)/multisubunit Na+/H+ antiporter MnhA subunit